MNLAFPTEVRSNAAGYTFLANLAAQLERLKARQISFEAAKLQWFDANLCSPLAATLLRARLRLNSFSWQPPHGPVLGIWMKNGFGQFIDAHQLPDTYDTTIAYRRFSLGEEKPFITYVGRELLTPGRLPGVTEGAKRRLEGYFHEIFNNAVIHSASTSGVFTCGQHFPHKERLDFTVTDLGIGFGEKVRAFIGDEREDHACIDWAMQPGNTTRRGDVPGGLGLKRLRDFALSNGGALHLVSGRGYWMINRAENGENLLNQGALTHRFPGTIINLSFDTRDEALYDDKDGIVQGEISLF